MSDDGIGGIFVFLKEFFGSGECNLIDVFLDIGIIHADSMVGDCNGAVFFVDAYGYFEFAHIAFEVAERGECL